MLTDCFNLMPGLVVDFLGTPAIVTSVVRDSDTEKIEVNLNTATGDYTIILDWGRGQQVRVIGLAVDCQPDNVDLFES